MKNTPDFLEGYMAALEWIEPLIRTDKVARAYARTRRTNMLPLLPTEEYGSDFCKTIYSCAANPQGLMGTA